MTKVDASAVTHKGLIRDNNEDNFFINGRFIHEYERNHPLQISYTDRQRLHLFSVCDGMGGEKSGEKASFIAVDEFQKLAGSLKTNLDELTMDKVLARLDRYVEQTNNLIHALSTQHSFHRMGSTFACLVLYENKAVALNIGDTRVYHFREGLLTQLTNDHTEAERLVRLGVLTREQARHHKSKHRLSRHFGISPEEGIMEADVSQKFEIHPNDVFLICSDGVTDLVDHERISQILASNDSSINVSNTLLNESLKNGGHDNITVLTANILEVGGAKYA